MRIILIFVAALLLNGCALTREPDNGSAKGPRIMGKYTTYQTSPTAAYNAGCSGRPLSTPGQRRRCGLAPL
jgi:hypothetical protein